jgi:Xaa-Pro aminopeptidase
MRGETVLVPGHVITIEPGVYLKGVGGCRIEDTVILTDKGFIDPYTISKQLIVV